MKKNNNKLKMIWILNLILFVSVVYFGIEVGGIGAEISRIEDKIEDTEVVKRDITETIFKGSGLASEERMLELGFNKPTNIVYLDTEESVASLTKR